MTDRTDPFKELAALFLTEPDAAAPTRPAADPTIELIVVGSLPVRASLWLVPYADTVARQLGPTALLRLDEEELCGSEMWVFMHSSRQMALMGPLTPTSSGCRKGVVPGGTQNSSMWCSAARFVNP